MTRRGLMMYAGHLINKRDDLRRVGDRGWLEVEAKLQRVYRKLRGDK